MNSRLVQAIKMNKTSQASRCTAWLLLMLAIHARLPVEYVVRYFDIFLKLGFKPHIIYRWKEQKIYIPKIPYIHGDAFRCEHHAIRKITNEMIANVRELIGYAKQKLSRLSL